MTRDLYAVTRVLIDFFVMGVFEGLLLSLESSVLVMKHNTSSKLPPNHSILAAVVETADMRRLDNSNMQLSRVKSMRDFNYRDSDAQLPARQILT